MSNFPYQRIMIIGCSGSGKSVLARKIARRSGLPLIHLDQEYWQAGWVESERLDWMEKVWELSDEEAWIIDGNYSGTMRIRLGRADLVIWLDYPTWLCLWRAVKRTLMYHGRTRPDMASGCPERLDWQFLTYILHFRKKHRPRILRIVERKQAHTELVILKSNRALRRWLNATFF